MSNDLYCIIVERPHDTPAFAGTDFSMWAEDFPIRRILIDSVDELGPLYKSDKEWAEHLAEAHEEKTGEKAHVIRVADLQPAKLREWHNRVKAELRSEDRERRDPKYGEELANRLQAEALFSSSGKGVEVEHRKRKKFKRPD